VLQPLNCGATEDCKLKTEELISSFRLHPFRAA